MRKTKNDSDVRKYRTHKAATQKLERQAYHRYVNNLIEINDPENDKQPKQKRFWNFIKTLRKDNT